MFGLGVLLVWIFVSVGFVKVILLWLCWIVLIVLVRLDNLFVRFVWLIDFAFLFWLLVKVFDCVCLIWSLLFDVDFCLFVLFVGVLLVSILFIVCAV